MIKNLLNKFFEIPRVYKRVVTIILDILMMVVAVIAAFFIRDDLNNWLSLPLYYCVGITIVGSIFVWSRIGLYKAVIRFIDTKVLSTIFLGAVISGIIFILSAYFLKPAMPRSVPFIYITLLLIFVGGSRLVIRGLITAQDSKSRLPVIIYGAGSSGRQLALSLQHGVEFQPVAFVDDKLELQQMSISGMRVYPRNQLVDLVGKYNVTKVLLAIPSASAQQRKKIISEFDALSVEVLTIPGTADLVSGKLQIDTLRKVDIIDLLGREAVKPIDRLFRRCIENKTVMVTGAGGSIGSELCRQIINQNPQILVLFESSEFALYAIEKELNEIALKYQLSMRIIPVLGNVIDDVLVTSVIRSYAVKTIYHAAAYKHVPIVENNVVSGIRNNVWGTKTCAQAASKCGVENFVLISTDKAVRPTNVMGSSKRLAELVLQALAAKEQAKDDAQAKTNFSMVRFGNVLGSSGSVVPLFKKQIAEGGPVTITHRDITRYFMTIPEAAQLVIQAGAMGQGGEVYVLDMGKPVKINDLAKKMIQLTGLTVKSELVPDGDIEITYTGLRPGEKLYEELLIGGNVEGTGHERIMKAKEVSMSWADLTQLLSDLEQSMSEFDIDAVRQLLIKAPLGFNPSSAIADNLWLAKNKADGVTAPMPTTAQTLRLVNS
jgi:FlaA1/EpsC-like NDP-sugar epimerase